MSLLSFLDSRPWANETSRIALKKGINGPSVSYPSLLRQAESLAKSFPSNTVVSSCLSNSIESVLVYLAIGSAGSAQSPLNPEYSESEFESFLRLSPGGLVVPASGNSAAEAAATKLGLPILRIDFGADGTVVFNGNHPRRTCEPHLVSAEQTAVILYTSGTTGYPKTVPLSHANIIASVQNIVQTYALSESDSTLAVMPFFHTHGLVGSLSSTLVSGGTVILPSSGKFSASTFFNELVANGCTWYTAVPTIHQILLGVDGSLLKEPLNRLRFIRSCSSALAPVLLHELERKFGVEMIEAYALSETCHEITSNPLGGRRKPGTVGLTHDKIIVRIYCENGRQLPLGTSGEVCVKGPTVIEGYLNNHEANARAFFDKHFFRTGDQGVIDSEGFLTITGRIKEIIDRGGEKISPLELDAILLAHPAVSEAITFPIPHQTYGETVGGAVVLKPSLNVSEAEIINFVASKVARFKVPARVFITGSLPKTATGKIQRRVVASHFLKDTSKL